MTDFKPETGDAFDHAVTPSNFMAWLSWLGGWFVLVVSVSYFMAHFTVWIHKGRPVVGDAYRSSHGNYWVVDREAISIQQNRSCIKSESLIQFVNMESPLLKTINLSVGKISLRGFLPTDSFLLMAAWRYDTQGVWGLRDE